MIEPKGLKKMIEPKGLKKSGIKIWNSLTDHQKFFPYYISRHLSQRDFVTDDDYFQFKKECKIYPWREQLLKNVNNPETISKEFLENLCDILADINENLEDLDNKKVDADSDW